MSEKKPKRKIVRQMTDNFKVIMREIRCLSLRFRFHFGLSHGAWCLFVYIFTYGYIFTAAQKKVHETSHETRIETILWR